MDVPRRQLFATLLVDILEFLASSNADQFADSTRPVYAGEAIQSERRLLSSFMSANGHPVSFLNVLGQVDRALLQSERGRLDRLYRIVLATFFPEQGAAPGNDRGEIGRLDTVIRAFYRLVDGKNTSRCCHSDRFR